MKMYFESVGKISAARISSLFILVFTCFYEAAAIKCYQCSSDQESKKDACGVFGKFNESAYAPVDCQGFEAVTPGTFCMKIELESPGLWGYWRTVHRRCASLSETGVSWGCYPSKDENNVQTEVCYCSTDFCNAATPQQVVMYKVMTLVTVIALPLIFWKL